jgi:flagellar motor switch protein FliN
MSEDIVVAGAAGWGLLAQIPLRLSVEIGAVSRTMQDLLALKQGAVIELDRPIDEPVDILANGTVIARGEVVNAGDHYGVRITEVIDAEAAMPRRERRQ